MYLLSTSTTVLHQDASLIFSRSLREAQAAQGERTSGTSSGVVWENWNLVEAVTSFFAPPLSSTSYFPEQKTQGGVRTYEQSVAQFPAFNRFISLPLTLMEAHGMRVLLLLPLLSLLLLMLLLLSLSSVLRRLLLCILLLLLPVHIRPLEKLQPETCKKNRRFLLLNL